MIFQAEEDGMDGPAWFTSTTLVEQRRKLAIVPGHGSELGVYLHAAISDRIKYIARLTFDGLLL